MVLVLLSIILWGFIDISVFGPMPNDINHHIYSLSTHKSEFTLIFLSTIGDVSAMVLVLWDRKQPSPSCCISDYGPLPNPFPICECFHVRRLSIEKRLRAARLDLLCQSAVIKMDCSRLCLTSIFRYNE